MFSCEIYETFKNTYFQEHQQSTASVCCEKLLFCMVLLISWGNSNSCNNFEYIQWSIINLMTNMLCTIIWLLSYMLVICSMTVSCIYKELLCVLRLKGIGGVFLRFLWNFLRTVFFVKHLWVSALSHFTKIEL